MRIISLKRLIEFWTRVPKAQVPLTHWYAATKAAGWTTLSDARKTFRHADPVKVASGNTVTVFNIGGNKYRLISAVHFDRQTVYVLRIMTHAEYDKEKWKEEL